MKRRFIAMIANGGAAPTYSISGTVYDADGTTAVASATVALGAASTTSGADGTYSITGLAAGTSGSMTCTKTGYVWTAISISAMAGNLTAQNYTNTWWAAGGIAAGAVGAYKAIGAADAAASYVNLKGGGHNLTEGVAPAFAAATGWTLTGTEYLVSDIVATNGWSLAVRWSNSTNALTRALMAAENASPYPRIGIYYNNAGVGNKHSYDYSSGGGGTTVSPTSGVSILTPQHGYIDGSSVKDIGAWTLAACTTALYIGCANVAGTAGRFSIAKIQAVAIYNTDVTASVAALNAAMAALA
jgi:hypothetical protein